MSPRTANLLLLLAGAVWGMGFIAQAGAMEDVGPMLFMTLRFLLAGTCVLPFAIRELRRSGQRINLSMLISFVPVSLFFFSGMAMQQIGLLETSVTNAGFLTALYVVLVPIILVFVFRQRQAFIVWPAAALAFLGIFLLSGAQLSALNWGDWVAITGAFFAALHVIYVGRVSQAIRLPVTMATVQFYLSAALAFVGYFITPELGLFEPRANLEIIYRALPEIFYAAVFAGALAFTLMAIGQQYTSSAAAAILLASESLFAAGFAALLLGEALTLLGYGGCLMIFVALLMVELKPPAKSSLQPGQ